MTLNNLDKRVVEEIGHLQATGQYKVLRHLTGPMGPLVSMEGHGEVVMLCSNDYLGLASHPSVVSAGIEGLKKYGAGTASVRFIAGTFDVHRDLERSIAEFVGTEAALTYVSAWNANEALFPTFASDKDVIISDSLNHASLIDSIRQVRGAARVIYQHGDLDEVEKKLQEYKDSAIKWLVTDGVFSMEGDIVDLPRLAALSRKYDAVLVVDDSHGVGVLGSTGRGTPEHYDLIGEVDILTGTLGKALGGAAGGYVAASRNVIDLLIQRSRTSIFSNALPLTVACSAKAAIDILRSEPERVDRLHSNVDRLRRGLIALGYECEKPRGDGRGSAIIPIIVGETADAIAKSARLLELGVMVIGFGFPVVPKGQARLRIQASASLENEHIEKALDAFARL